MANIFGSRYTSPGGAGAVWEATADLAQTGFDIGLGIMEQVDSAEAESQLRSLDVGMIERYDDFSAWMSENPSNPDAFLTEFDTRAKQWKTDLIEGVTQKRAQQTASGNIDKNIARWRTEVRRKQYQQKAHNVGVDAEIDVKKLTAVPNRMMDDGDVTERIKALGLRVAQMWDGQQFDTEKQRDAYLQDNQKKIVSHYALQQADVPEDFDALNRIFKETGWIGAEGFDPDDITDLKKRFEQKQNIAEGEKNDRAEVFDKDTRKKILAGGAILPTLRDEILNNPDISGPQMQTLINLYESRLDGVGKKYSNEEKLAAHAEIQDEKDSEKKVKLLFEHANAFEPSDLFKRYDSIVTPTAKDFEDSDVAKDLKGLVNTLSATDEQKFVLTSKGYGLLREAIESAEAPLDLTQKKQKVLEIFNMLQSQVKELPLEKILPEAILTPKQRTEALGEWLDKAVAENRAYRRRQTKTIVRFSEPKTQAEFDALPKGARYRRSDGTTWIKR